MSNNKRDIFYVAENHVISNLKVMDRSHEMGLVLLLLHFLILSQSAAVSKTKVGTFVVAFVGKTFFFRYYAFLIRKIYQLVRECLKGTVSREKCSN